MVRPNPLERILKRAKKRGQKRFLCAWNRGLGDIALGLYGLVERIYEVIPDAEITFLVRQGLEEGFQLLEGIQVEVARGWERGKVYEVEGKGYDVVIPWPDPGYWLKWQRGTVIPRLKWDEKWEGLYRRFGLEGSYVGMQMSAETAYGTWRNWPQERWIQLIERLGKRGKKVLLFGFGKEPLVEGEHVVDLRGKTNLFELLSIIKNKCGALVLPDSGILSMSYYLDVSFPIHIVSLWGDPRHGILKQGVSSPNPLLRHTPLMGGYRDLGKLTADMVENAIHK